MEGRPMYETIAILAAFVFFYSTAKEGVFAWNGETKEKDEKETPL